MKPLRIVIFAKAPLPGYAKTRLIPELGQEGAAKLAARFLQHTVQEALASDLGEVELCVTPDMQHPDWKTLGLPNSIGWSEQGEGDLGDRLSRVARRVIDSGKAVLLLGTDCPALDSQTLKNAASALESSPITMVPVADGGYALLGLNDYHSTLFSDIPWSTSDVAKLTKQRALSLGWSFAEQQTLNDIDEPADLRWLPSSFFD